MTSAGFNRRMRKTACPVVWKGHGVKSPVPPSDAGTAGCRLACPVVWDPWLLGLYPISHGNPIARSLTHHSAH